MSVLSMPLIVFGGTQCVKSLLLTYLFILILLLVLVLFYGIFE